MQEAGIPKKYAPTIGISVDYRRQNLSEESLAENVERLVNYFGPPGTFHRHHAAKKSS